MPGPMNPRATWIDRLRTRIEGHSACCSSAVRRRTAIVDAAGALFVAQGVDATSVDEIVAKAGVAKGTFYNYFAGKADVLSALRLRFCDDFLHRVVTAVTQCPGSDFDCRLNGWIGAAVIAYADMHLLHDVVFHGAEMPRRVAMGDEPILEHLADLLQAGTAAGAWAVDSPRQVSVLMFHGMHGAVDEALASGDDPAEIIPLLTRLFARMIGATDPPSRGAIVME